MAGVEPKAQAGFRTIPVLPGEPLATLSEDYTRAEITVVYERAANRRRLLLAVFELLPGLLDAAPEGTQSETLPGGVELNVSRWHVPAADGVALYRGCRNGSLQLPPFVDPRGRTHEVVVTVEPCDDEPAWSGFVLEDHPFWGSTPFWGDRPGGTRWHLQIPLHAQTIWETWTIAQQDRAAKWLRNQLNFDLQARPVLWGSVHLRLPNPVFSNLAQSLSTDGRKITLRFTPYPGRTVRDLQVTFREQRSNGSTYSFIAGAEPLMVLEVPWPPSLTSVEVRCPHRGLLYSSPSSTFIRSIQLGMSLVTRERQVVAPSRSKRRDADKFVVPVVTEVEQQMVGSPAPIQPALARLAVDEDAFRTKQRGEELGQRWFGNQRDEAAAFIRGLIGEARSSVYIVDAYFDAYALRNFAIATQVARLPVRILTSAKHLQTETHGRYHGDILAAELKAVVEQDPSINIDVRVARGESRIHDRFLVIDDAVWQPGSSLYDFGARGSTIVRLPHPLPVRVPIEEAWADAPELATFIAERQAARRPKLSLLERMSVLWEAVVTAWSGRREG